MYQETQTFFANAFKYQVLPDPQPSMRDMLVNYILLEHPYTNFM